MLPLVLPIQVPRAALLSAASAALLLVFTSACQPETDRPVLGDLLYEGDYVDVYANPGTPICAGSFAEIDRVSHELRKFAEQWNVSWMERKYRYNWLDEEEWTETRPCGSNKACHYTAHLDTPSTIYARSLFLHEVVHAVFGPAQQSLPIFEEGLAEILADGESAVLPGFDSTSLSSLYAESLNGISRQEYHKAAFATRFLLDHYGEAGMNIITSTTRMMSYDQLQDLLTRSNLSIELLDEQLLAAQVCELPGTRVNLPECTSGEVKWKDITHSIRTTLDCDDTSTHGPVNGNAYKVITLTIPTPGSYEITISSDHDEISGKLGRCNKTICEFTDSASREHELTLTTQERTTATLSAGKHWLRLQVPFDSAVEIITSIQPTSLGESGETDSPSEEDTMTTTTTDLGNEFEDASTSTSDTSSTWPDPSTGTSDTDSTEYEPDVDCDGYQVCMPTVVTASGFSFEYGGSRYIIESESHGFVLPLCSCETEETHELLALEAPHAVEAFEGVALELCLAFAQDEITAAVQERNWPEEQVATQLDAATASVRASCEAGLRRRYSTTNGAVPFVTEGRCSVDEPETECS